MERRYSLKFKSQTSFIICYSNREVGVECWIAWVAGAGPLGTAMSLEPHFVIGSGGPEGLLASRFQVRDRLEWAKETSDQAFAGISSEELAELPTRNTTYNAVQRN